MANRFIPIVPPISSLGLTFRNHVGLAAGFDKNAKYLFELELLGFGFVEIGTVTPLPQIGNGKPRLYRLRKDRALINRMGFNNEGVIKIAERLRLWKEKQRLNNEVPNKVKMLIGGNLGKNKDTSNDDAWRDYQICFLELFDYVDYFVVNVSSPNTPGLRELQEKESLRNILSRLQSINLARPHPRPLLLKIAPDLNLEQLNDIVDLSIELNLSGIVATNTTISRDNLSTTQFDVESMGTGGLSGYPLQRKSTEIVRYIHEKSGGKLTIIGSGGIFNSHDAEEKKAAGATLIQVWTGFVYEGPGIVKQICSDRNT